MVLFTSGRIIVININTPLSPDNVGETRISDNFGGDNFGRTGPPDS